MTHFKSTSFVVLILFATLSSMPQSRVANDSEASAELRISSAKSEYLLGEPVSLERRLIKIGDYDRVEFPDDDRQGALIVFIAKGDGEFKQYQTVEGSLVYKEYPVGPGQSKAFYPILFNRKPRTEGLSDYGRRESEKGMILTDYAFPEPGEYRIKAVRLYFVRRGEDRYATSARAESNVISIRIREPEGEDLSVWGTMRDDPRIGFFMTEGVVPYRFPSIEDTFLAEIDRIVTDHPDSYLAGLLKVKAQENRARQERYRLEEERRRQQKAASATKIN